MLHVPITLATAPLIALLLAADAGTIGIGVSDDAAPAAPSSRPPPAMPIFPALGVSRTRADEDVSLKNANDGSGDLIHEASGFSARIAPDGGVTFKDQRINLLGPLSALLPSTGPRNVPSLQATILGLARNRHVPEVDPDAKTDESFLLFPGVSPYRADPKEGCRECTRAPLALLPMNVTGRFDLTDELLRFSKQDPYRYKKARFLALTREMRIERAAANHAANLRRATGDLPLLLERIACDLGLMRRERVAIIQKLRDDLDLETPEGEAAAQRIDQFLQVLAGRFAAPLTKDGCTAPPKSP